LAAYFCISGIVQRSQARGSAACTINGYLKVMLVVMEVNGMNMARLNFLFSPAAPLFDFLILQLVIWTFPEKNSPKLPDFLKKVPQGYRTFLKLSGNVIELFKNCSPKFPDFPGKKSG
jgi:hypothetical protein